MELMVKWKFKRPPLKDTLEMDEHRNQERFENLVFLFSAALWRL